MLGSMVAPARLAVLGLVLVVLSVSACGEQRKAELPVHDDFADCSTGWSTAHYQFFELDCVDGGYRFVVNEAHVINVSTLYFRPQVGSLSIGADAALRAGPPDTLYGISCWFADDTMFETAYIFGLTGDGNGVILRDDLDSGVDPTLLAKRHLDSYRASGTNHIRGTCVGGRSTLLTLFVNGKEIVTAKAHQALVPFSEFGFAVQSSKVGAEAWFDNFEAKKLTGA